MIISINVSIAKRIILPQNAVLLPNSLVAKKEKSLLPLSTLSTGNSREVTETERALPESRRLFPGHHLVQLAAHKGLRCHCVVHEARCHREILLHICVRAIQTMTCCDAELHISKFICLSLSLRSVYSYCFDLIPCIVRLYFLLAYLPLRGMTFSARVTRVDGLHMTEIRR